jgi:hypothetical protein
LAGSVPDSWWHRSEPRPVRPHKTPSLATVERVLLAPRHRLPLVSPVNKPFLGSETRADEGRKGQKGRSPASPAWDTTVCRTWSPVVAVLPDVVQAAVMLTVPKPSWGVSYASYPAPLCSTQQKSALGVRASLAALAYPDRQEASGVLLNRFDPAPSSLRVEGRWSWRLQDGGAGVPSVPLAPPSLRLRPIFLTSACAPPPMA